MPKPHCLCLHIYIYILPYERGTSIDIIDILFHLFLAQLDVGRSGHIIRHQDVPGKVTVFEGSFEVHEQYEH